MKKRLVIRLDFDGCFTRIDRQKALAAKRMFGIDVPPEKFGKAYVVKEKKLLDAEQYKALLAAIYNDREIGMAMEVVDGLHEGLVRLRAGEHDIAVVTSRGPNELELAKQWTQAKGIEIDFVGVGAGNSKAAACAGADFFLEDDGDKLEPLVCIVPNLALLSWPANEGYDVESIGGRRVGSWGEFCDWVDQIANT